MSEKPLNEPDYSRTQPRVDEIKKLLEDTWAANAKSPVYADWLCHEACGHNELAQAIVLYGLNATEAWDFVLMHHGKEKAQGMRRRLQESKEAFASKLPRKR